MTENNYSSYSYFSVINIYLLLWVLLMCFRTLSHCTRTLKISTTETSTCAFGTAGTVRSAVCQGPKWTWWREFPMTITGHSRESKLKKILASLVFKYRVSKSKLQAVRLKEQELWAVLWKFELSSSLNQLILLFWNAFSHQGDNLYIIFWLLYCIKISWIYTCNRINTLVLDDKNLV